MPMVGAVAGVAAVAALLTALFLRRRTRLHQRAKLSDVAQPASAALSAALFTQSSAEEASGGLQSGELQSGERPSANAAALRSKALHRWADRSKKHNMSFSMRTYSSKNLNVAKFEMKRRSENLSAAGAESAGGDMSVSTSVGVTEGSLAAGQFVPDSRKSSHALSSGYLQEGPPSRRRNSTLPNPQVLPLLACSFIYSLTLSLTTHLLAHSLTHSLAHSLTLTHTPSWHLRLSSRGAGAAPARSSDP